MEYREKEKNQRVQQEEIGGTIYTVIAEEMSGRRKTAFEIIGGLVKRNYEKGGLAVCERTEVKEKWN